MEKALIITAPIRSHVLPSFYLAEMLSHEYDVAYATASGSLEKLIRVNGYKHYTLDSVRFASGFDPIDVYNRSGRKRTLKTFFQIFYNAYRHKTFFRRREELNNILNKTKFSVVAIDIFSATDLLVVRTLDLKLKVFFYNPMLNTFDSPYPDVRGNYKQFSSSDKPLYKKWFYKLSPLTLLINASGYNPSGQLKWVYHNYPFLNKYSRYKENKIIRSFQNTPEVILAPLELEFGPDVRRAHQIYSGFSIPKKRHDVDTDSTFDKSFQEILKLKGLGRKLVYCSFGTYFSSKDEHRYVIAFFTLLIHAFRNEGNIEFVIASKESITGAVKAQTNVPAHFSFFTKVPQLSVLAHSDLFITHGGLGSIKEALSYAVPMVVYPLDLTWDQSGNAAKVQHHGLGVSGNFKTDSALEIYNNVTQVLNKPIYGENCRKFKDGILQSYNCSQTSYSLNKLMECTV